MTTHHCEHGPQRGRGHGPPSARPGGALTGRTALRLQGAASMPLGLATRRLALVVALTWWQREDGAGHSGGNARSAAGGGTGTAWGGEAVGCRAARSRATVHGAPEGTVGGTAGGMATAISMLTASAWSHCHCHRHRHRTQPWRRRRRARWRGGQHDHHTHVCTEREHGHTTTHAWRRRCGHGPQRGRGHAPSLARPRRKGPPSVSLRHALTGRAARRLQGAASVSVGLAARCFDRVASTW